MTEAIAIVRANTRPWLQPGWCDENGRLWFGRPEEENCHDYHLDEGWCPTVVWELRQPEDQDIVADAKWGDELHCLPAFAIPVPIRQRPDDDDQL